MTQVFVIIEVLSNPPFFFYLELSSSALCLMENALCSAVRMQNAVFITQQDISLSPSPYTHTSEALCICTTICLFYLNTFGFLLFIQSTHVCVTSFAFALLGLQCGSKTGCRTCLSLFGYFTLRNQSTPISSNLELKKNKKNIQQLLIFAFLVNYQFRNELKQSNTHKKKCI